ncbi:MAG: tRNA (5-methylaminomethyl-2-thiouridine)(34)-methyltransferase MnmD, partial [Pseudomonadales bacterium]|nr:tRNA (5-methylaminomethyl-2-thiouridine)(34)-methyltransferase MnmD [Pseudomonadales bacterium]
MSKTLENIEAAKLEWDEQGQPFSTLFNDVYFSKASGLEESRYVFLQANNLQERFSLLGEYQHFVIAETGFGTGLNFLAAWQLFSQSAPANAHLHFISTELHPLKIADLQRALALWPELSALSSQLIDSYPMPTPGMHFRNFESGRIHLSLLLGDANVLLPQVLDSDHPAITHTESRAVDAWFLDGFAPAKNPALWSEQLLQTLGRLSRIGTTAATFTAAGDVKRALQSVGFSVKKITGFGKKRDMITAVKTESNHIPYKGDTEQEKTDPRHSAHDTPWHLSSKTDKKPEHVVIIGSGIAACTTARTLANKGIKVTVIDKNPAAARGASGNPQAVLYSKISTNDGYLSRFVLASYPYALHYYQQLQREYPDLVFHPCGVMQLAVNEKTEKQQGTLCDYFNQIDNALPCFLNTEQATDIANLPIKHAALFFEKAGWLNPENVC